MWSSGLVQLEVGRPCISFCLLIQSLWNPLIRWFFNCIPHKINSFRSIPYSNHAAWVLRSLVRVLYDFPSEMCPTLTVQTSILPFFHRFPPKKNHWSWSRNLLFSKEGAPFQGFTIFDFFPIWPCFHPFFGALTLPKWQCDFSLELREVFCQWQDLT